MYGGHGKVLRAPKCLRIVHEKASKGIKFTSYSDQCVRWPWPLKRRGTAWYSFWMWFEPSLRVCVLVHCSLLFILCSCGHPVCLNQDSLQVALPILHSRYSHQIVLHVQPSDWCCSECRTTGKCQHSVCLVSVGKMGRIRAFVSNSWELPSASLNGRNWTFSSA